MDIVKAQSQELSSREASFSELIDAFITAQDVRTSSKEVYRRQLRQFSRWLEETYRTGKGLQREDIVAYREHLSERLTPLSVSGYLTAVRKFFEWMEAEKIYPNIAKVKSPKKPRGYRKDCLTKEQLRGAIQTADVSTVHGKRDRALINLLARTGLRTIEASRAQIGDIRQEAGQPVLWIQGKGRDDKDDFVLLSEKALAPLQEYLDARTQQGASPLKESAPLFASVSSNNYGEAMTTRSISRIVKDALRKAGANSSRLTAHSLRHTAITLSIAGGASIQQAQAMARHSDPKTTMIYLHNLERVKDGAEHHIDF